MLANGQEASEIRSKLDIPADVIRDAIAGWQAEACPLALLPEVYVEHVVNEEIGGFMRLTMVRVDARARQEFSDQLLAELAAVPYSLLCDAMAEARRRVSFPERLVPFVFDFVEARAEKLRAEGERLNALLLIATGSSAR